GVFGGRGAVGVQPEQGECPGARRRETLRAWQRLDEQCGGPTAPRRCGIAPRAFAQRPERPPVAVLRAAVFQPNAIKAHEITKSPRFRVPGMLDKGRQARSKYFGHAPLARLVERTSEDQGPGVIVDAITMGTIRHG